MKNISLPNMPIYSYQSMLTHQPHEWHTRQRTSDIFFTKYHPFSSKSAPPVHALQECQQHPDFRAGLVLGTLYPLRCASNIRLISHMHLISSRLKARASTRSRNLFASFATARKSKGHYAEPQEWPGEAPPQSAGHVSTPCPQTMHIGNLHGATMAGL